MEDKLSRALRSLPRQQARPGFSDRVLRRIDDLDTRPEQASRARRWRWPAMVAAAACLLVFTTSARDWWEQHQQRQGLARLASIESERQALLIELESLQRQMARARPQIYVGGTNDIDFVLDVGRLRRSGYPRLGSASREMQRFEIEQSRRAATGRAATGRAATGRSATSPNLDILPASFTSARSTIY